MRQPRSSTMLSNNHHIENLRAVGDLLVCTELSVYHLMVRFDDSMLLCRRTSTGYVHYHTSAGHQKFPEDQVADNIILVMLGDR